MSWLQDIPPDVIRLALDGAEALARAIAKKLGREDDLEAIERIKDRMLESAFAEGIGLGLALADVSHGAESVLRAMEAAEKSPTVPRIEGPFDFDTSETKP